MKLLLVMKLEVMKKGGNKIHFFVIGKVKIWRAKVVMALTKEEKKH